MNVDFIPNKDKILIKPLPNTGKVVTLGNVDPNRGEIVAVGENVKQYKVGDIVEYRNQAGVFVYRDNWLLMGDFEPFGKYTGEEYEKYRKIADTSIASA